MSEDKEVKPVHGMFAVPAPPAFDFNRTSLEGDRPTKAATAARNQRRTFGSASQQPGRRRQTTAAPKEFFRTEFRHLVKDQCTGHTRSSHKTTVLPTSHIQLMPQLRSRRAPEDLLFGTSCEMQLLRLFRTFCSGVSEKGCRRAKEDLPLTSTEAVEMNLIDAACQTDLRMVQCFGCAEVQRLQCRLPATKELFRKCQAKLAEFRKQR
ncbi:hypothetical protein MRX96_033027 [Rhipicephalus microplus]